MKNISGKLTIAGLLLASTAFGEPWSPDSDPFTVNRNYSAFFSNLPSESMLSDTALPWSGPYWADRKGSIAFRWQDGKRPWQYPLLTVDQAKNLTPREIALLSPAEKFDLLRGLYDFPTLKAIRLISGKGKKAWFGICTGWAQASLHFDQPKPITLRNPDGLLIPFGSGDLKALASYYYAYPGEEDRVTARIGTRCDRGDLKRDCRRDVNAGALHIIIANRVGLEKQGLIADMSRGIQVWQNPIYGYESRTFGERSPQKNASPFAVREIFVKTKLFYAKETAADWELTSIFEKSRHLNYWLELDADGQIVGGTYANLAGGRVPDYVWISEPLSFSHGWEILGTVITPKGTDPVPSKQPKPEIDPDSDI